MKFFTDGPDGSGQTQQPPSIEETAGIPTGLAPDIKRQIDLRKKNVPLSQGPAPDGAIYSPGA